MFQQLVLPTTGDALVAEICASRFSGRVTLEGPLTELYALNGTVYFVDRPGAPGIDEILLTSGTIGDDDLEAGTIRIAGVPDYGRMFERVPALDADPVRRAVEAETNRRLAELTQREIPVVHTVPGQKHPNGLHRWVTGYGSQTFASIANSSGRPEAPAEPPPTADERSSPTEAPLAPQSLPAPKPSDRRYALPPPTDGDYRRRDVLGLLVRSLEDELEHLFAGVMQTPGPAGTAAPAQVEQTAAEPAEPHRYSVLTVEADWQDDELPPEARERLVAALTTAAERGWADEDVDGDEPDDEPDHHEGGWFTRLLPRRP